MFSVSCLRTAEEQEMVRRVLRKLHNERHRKYHPVLAGLCEMSSEEIANEKGRARRTETK